ncbi:MAG: DUF350 domain-containing protein [Verrucomicrobiota bacterium]
MTFLLSTLSLDDTPVLQPLVPLLEAIPFFVYALLILVLGKVFYERTSHFSFLDELTERDNPAFGACLAGYLLGIALALTGAFPTGPVSNLIALRDMTTGGVLALLLMRASIWINDQLILSHFSIDVEMLRDRNLGTGAAVAGSCVGTGLVLAGALTGNSADWLHSVRDVAVYWAVGQALFIGGAWAFYHTAGYDVQETMEHDNNAAAGISLGGFLASLGVLLWALLQNASSDLLVELTAILVTAVIGISLLLLSSIVTRKLLLPHINLPKEITLDKNTAAGIICATASLATALLLAASFLSRYNSLPL